MADDGKRRAYLSALGIQGWVRRTADAPLRPGHGARPPAEEPVSQETLQETTAGQAEPPAADPRPAHDLPSPPVSPTPPAAPTADLSRLDWEALQAAVANCTACDLHRTRTQAVFGSGDRQADLMIVGEAPGAEEDRQGEPFVGRAGQLLDQMLRAIALDRRQVFITNVVKCRPPNNRNPHVDEIAHCLGYLRRQIELVSPRVILVLGRIAANGLLGGDNTLASLRGRPHSLDGIPLVVTYHPAYLLRTPRDKAKSWADLRLTRRLLQGATA